MKKGDHIFKDGAVYDSAGDWVMGGDPEREVIERVERIIETIRTVSDALDGWTLTTPKGVVFEVRGGRLTRKNQRR